jgi:hypothetical protein
MPELEQFREYTTLPVLDNTFYMFKPRAELWRTKSTVGVTGLDETEVVWAECAFILHLIGKEEVTRVGSRVGTRKAGRVQVDIPVNVLGILKGNADDWLDTAYGHLYDAGLPKPEAFAGVAR